MGGCCAGARQSAAVASVSVLATLLAVTGCWAAAALIRHRRRRAAKYDVFPLFGNGDVSWYPPDYRRAIIGAEAVLLLADDQPWLLAAYHITGSEKQAFVSICLASRAAPGTGKLYSSQRKRVFGCSAGKRL